MTSNYYTKDQWEKLGQSLIFMAARVPNLAKTKALKLIYLLEETALVKQGVPFFGLRFDVWRLGPVVRDVFVELSGETVLLSDYITLESQADGTKLVKAVKEFSDDEFSENDLALLNLVTDTFKNRTANELIALTHRKHSPWHITAQRNDLLEPFEEKLINSTDVEIDFTSLFTEDKIKQSIYEDYLEYLGQRKHLKQ